MVKVCISFSKSYLSFLLSLILKERRERGGRGWREEKRERGGREEGENERSDTICSLVANS
jgi:hypothetical protein